jgi:hypothetical protein
LYGIPEGLQAFSDVSGPSLIHSSSKRNTAALDNVNSVCFVLRLWAPIVGDTKTSKCQWVLAKIRKLLNHSNSDRKESWNGGLISSKNGYEMLILCRLVIIRRQFLSILEPRR